MFSTTLGKCLLTFFVAMVPVIELRGAIPVGVAHGLEFWQAVVISCVGNMVPVPFILLFIKRIFGWLRTLHPKLESFVGSMEKRAENKSKSVARFEFFGLFLLVAIPLPGTGAWTGALVAAMLGMEMKKSVPAIFLGILAAAAIVTAITYGAFRVITG